MYWFNFFSCGHARYRAKQICPTPRSELLDQAFEQGDEQAFFQLLSQGAVPSGELVELALPRISITGLKLMLAACDTLPCGIMYRAVDTRELLRVEAVVSAGGYVSEWVVAWAKAVVEPQQEIISFLEQALVLQAENKTSHGVINPGDVDVDLVSPISTVP